MEYFVTGTLQPYEFAPARLSLESEYSEFPRPHRSYRDYLKTIPAVLDDLMKFVRFRALLITVEGYQKSVEESTFTKTYLLKIRGRKLDVEGFAKAAWVRPGNLEIREVDEITSGTIVNILKEEARECLPRTIPVLARAYSSETGFRMAARDIAANPKVRVNPNGWFFGDSRGRKERVTSSDPFEFELRGGSFISDDGVLVTRWYLDMATDYDVFYSRWNESGAQLQEFKRKLQCKDWRVRHEVDVD